VLVCEFPGLGSVPDNASDCASGISRTTRGFDVRICAKRSRAPHFAIALYEDFQRLPLMLDAAASTE